MKKEAMRTVKDSMGTIEVPADRLYGAQTARTLANFRIGSQRMPLAIVRALALVKKVAAEVNCSLGVLAGEKAQWIIKAADEVIAGEHDDQFPLPVWQTGSGTQSNMNVNEVIAYRAEQLAAAAGTALSIHPNDDVNRSQSSNDTFPTAMNLAAVDRLQRGLLPAIDKLYATLSRQSDRWMALPKSGRTHLMDAVPISLGQEFSGYATQAHQASERIALAMISLYELPLGGTAVGTGLNAPAQFALLTANRLAAATKLPFLSAVNKFAALASHDGCVVVSGALKALACALIKIGNDLRWMASGPRCGLGELSLPANEPGSSIMPGKVNPTQIEAMTMVAAQVIGNDAAITFSASQGNFELNVYKPVIAHNLLQSIDLLTDAIHSFVDHALVGILPNEEQLAGNLHRSLMLVTALNPHIGYDAAAKIAKKAYADGTTLKEAGVALGLVTAQEFDAWVRPEDMLGSRQAEA